MLNLSSAVANPIDMPLASSHNGGMPTNYRLDGDFSPLLQGLPALVDQRTRILVLGSFPSVASLEGQRYYGHPRNHFWEIVARCLGTGEIGDWLERYENLLSHGLGLWDVIGSCRRPGSLDRDIKDPAPNDISSLLERFPDISRIAINGATAGRLFAKYIAPGLAGEWQTKTRVFRLPSTSPIPSRDYRHAADKLPLWRQALTLA